jgi:tetratricopeptide (TPR) repeat protein
MRQKCITALLFFVMLNTVLGQDNKSKALTKARLAVKMMDNGQIDESIVMLKECQKLDPKNIVYSYELGYAYYQKKEFETAKKYLKKVVKHENANSGYYQMLGNIYDLLGNSKKALKTYSDGLKRFPKAGNLYLEKGTIFNMNKQYNAAINNYELGIKVDPSYASNYYRATQMYMSSSDEVWGMIYGEIFMNLEANSDRTVEISKLLFDTYKSEIKIINDTSKAVSFSANILNLSDLKKMKLPFPAIVYEPTLLLSIIDINKIDLASLNRIRTRFVDNYFDSKHNEKYPNILFDYHKKLIDSGHFEAYNYWILMKGDEKAFSEWKDANKEKWEAFVKWFTNNRLVVDEEHAFSRLQYN